MSADDARALWERQCGIALATPRDDEPMSQQADLLMDAARQLLSVAHHIGGVACAVCHGTGERIYGSTSTWRGGIGGCAMTMGVCDRCWGTGRTDVTGPDLRQLAREAASR